MKLVDENWSWFNLKKSWFKGDGIVVQLDTKWGPQTVIWFLLQWSHIEREKPMRGKRD